MRLTISTRTVLKTQQRVPTEGRAVHSWEQWRESGYSLRQSYSVLQCRFIRSPPRHQLEPPHPPLARPLERVRVVGLENRVAEDVEARRDPSAHHRRAVIVVRRRRRSAEPRTRAARPRHTRVDERGDGQREEGHVEQSVLRHAEQRDADLEAGDGELAAEQSI